MFTKSKAQATAGQIDESTTEHWITRDDRWWIVSTVEHWQKRFVPIRREASMGRRSGNDIIEWHIGHHSYASMEAVVENLSHNPLIYLSIFSQSVSPAAIMYRIFDFPTH